MSRVVRQSKYRHVFGTNLKQDACYTAINTNKNSANGTFCAVNPKFIAFSINSTGGGAFQVLPLTQTGRMSPKQPSFNAHKTAVLTLEFSPFNDNLLATCADNGEVMLWEIPDEGIKENQDEPLATLQKHKKRVNLLKWNPVADNILISAGSENFICVWNTETGELIYEIPLPDSVFDVCWNHNGTEIATTCRDKALRVYDVRSQELLHEKEKCCGSSTFMTCNYVLKNKLFLTAKVAGAKQYFLFDLKNLDVPLETDELPGDSGYSFPFYDEASSVMFVTTKGQSAIPYYEIVDEEPYVHYISTHSAPTSQQGMAWLPKRALDLKSVEIAKFFKVTKDKIEPISMRVPRKSDVFQDDLFPPAPSSDPALTADEWIGGATAEPKLTDLEQFFKSEGSCVSEPKKIIKRTFTKKAPAQNGAAQTADVDMTELLDDIKKLKSTVRKLNNRVTTLEQQLQDVVQDGEQE